MSGPLKLNKCKAQVRGIVNSRKRVKETVRRLSSIQSDLFENPDHCGNTIRVITIRIQGNKKMPEYFVEMAMEVVSANQSIFFFVGCFQ